MRRLSLLLFISAILFSCSNENRRTGDIPTEADVASAMKKAYEHSSSAGEDYKIEIRSIKIGDSHIADLKQELNNIPKGTTVTNVVVDYSFTAFINSSKSTGFWVYKNEFGEWKMLSNSAQ